MKSSPTWKNEHELHRRLAPDAEQELAALWMDAANRTAVTWAAHEIDGLLRHNPKEQGESRSLGRRVFFVRPLGVFFRVYSSDRVVQVQHVWRFKTHS